MATENYHWDYFVLREVIRADISDVYKAWTQPAELEAWFLKEAKYITADGTIIDQAASIEAGMTYAWKWYGYDGVEEGKVIEANGQDKLAFSFAGDCVVTVELIEARRTTVMVLKQENIPLDEKSKVDIHLGCSKGWLFYMTNLKGMLKGAPDLRVKSPEILQYLKDNPVADLM